MDEIPSPHPWWGSLLSSSHVHRWDPPHNRKHCPHARHSGQGQNSASQKWADLSKIKDMSNTAPKSSKFIPPIPTPSHPPSPRHPNLPRPHTLRPPLDTWPARTWAPHPPTMPPRAAARPLEAPEAAPYPRAPTWSRAGYTKKGAGMRGTRRKLAFMGDVPVSIMISYHIIPYHIISYQSVCLSVRPSVCPDRQTDRQTDRPTDS